MSRVFSIELDGISNACTTKVMMNNPVTSTAASDAKNSTVVSRGFSSAPLFASLSRSRSFFATMIHPSRLRPQKLDQRLVFKGYGFRRFSPHQPQRPAPSRDLKNMSDRICEVIKLTTDRRRCRHLAFALHRPVNQQRPPNNILLRHKSPIPAVVTIVAIVSHHEIMPLGNNQLPVFHQL